MTARTIPTPRSVYLALINNINMINRKAQFLLEVARGRIEGHSIIQKFGSSAVTATQTTWKIVATSLDYPTPTTVTSLEMVSDDNTNDFHPDNSASKTGAHTVRVYGLDANWLEITEDVKLNGTTAVALTNSFFRVFRMKLVQSGTYASVSGASHNSTITLRVASAGATWAQISTEGGFGFGQSEIGAYTIPAGKTGYLLSKKINVSGTNKDIDVAFFVRENADDVTTPFSGVMQLKEIDRNLPSGAQVQVQTDAPMIVIPAKSDCGFFAKNKALTNYETSVEFELLIIDN